MMLKGLTWDHPRGYAPLLAGVEQYCRQYPELTIQWDRRSLREFGEAPIENYVDGYDLLIVDHPFVGYAAAHDVLHDFSPFLSDAEKKRFAADSVGPSWNSYWYAAKLWALPVDAATQVSSYRPDLLHSLSAEVPQTFEDVLVLANRARESGKYVVVPACPTDAISLFFTLTASLGSPIPEETEVFAETAITREVMQRLHRLIKLVHPRSVDWNPIQVYDFMVSGNQAVYCPYGFGYSNYSRAGRSPLLKFADAPSAGSQGCAGTMLGGTGVAVSHQSRHPGEAVAYAKWLASPQHQAGAYFDHGGQPASLAAWTDPAVNAACNAFFSSTLHTLQTAYVRPRFSGFVQFFETAGIEINRCLRGNLDDTRLIQILNETYARQREKFKIPR
jgi:multiple sugar transport system substrate-binding protein